MSNLIIVDRKRKKAHSDNQWNDPLGVEQARHEKSRTIDVPNDSNNPIHSFIRASGSHKLLLGKTAYCLTDKQEMMSGKIVDVIPPNYLMLRNKGIAKFENCIALGE